VTRPEPPNLILLLYTDRADAVTSVLLEQGQRLRCEVLAMSLSQLINEAIVGRTWKWAERTIDPSRTAVFGVRPTPGLISDYLSASDQRAVSDWIKLNEGAIVEYWDGVIDTAELLVRLKRV